MTISGLRVRIIIQKNITITDRLGNHSSEWTDYFSCWATAVASGLSTVEKQEAGHTIEENRLDITVRYCSETAVVDSKQYRVLLNDEIYNITSVDDMAFRRKSLKFHTMLVER